MMSRAQWMLLFSCLLLVLVHPPARPQSLVDRSDVLRGLQTLERSGRSGEAEWLLLQSAMDSLSPQDQRQWLERLIKGMETIC